jgi:hypothetical protein
MLDLAAARAWLRDHLPEGEPVELSDEATLDRAAAVVWSPSADERKEAAA